MIHLSNIKSICSNMSILNSLLSIFSSGSVSSDECAVDCNLESSSINLKRVIEYANGTDIPLELGSKKQKTYSKERTLYKYFDSAKQAKISIKLDGYKYDYGRKDVLGNSMLLPWLLVTARAVIAPC